MSAIRRTITVGAEAAHAFHVFTEGLATWWPRAYTWAGEVLGTIAIEPRAGGFCYERGPFGFRCDWGRVLAWEPPHRIVFTWQIGPDRVPQPDPERASEVEVRFTAVDGGTRIELEHSGFDRHGDDAVKYRDAMDSEYGWPMILARYAEAVDD